MPTHFANARSEYDLFDGRAVSSWSYWRGGAPPAGTSRLELVQERYDFAQRKLARADGLKTKAMAARAAAETSYGGALERWGEAARANMEYTFYGPKKRDLQDHEDRMLIVAKARRRNFESAEHAVDDADEDCFRFRRCVKAARVGLEAATWAEAALGRSPAAHANGASVVGAAARLLDDVDDLGVSVGLSSLLASVQSEGRATAWRATPYASQWWTVDVLSVVLALGAVCHDFRSAIRAWVGATLAQLDFSEHAQRCEFPRDADSHNGIQRPLHYDESVLSYVEPQAQYVMRTLATLDLETRDDEFKLRWIASTGSATLRAIWPFKDCELRCEAGGSIAVEPSHPARARKLRRALEEEVRAHAAKRAGRVMPLSLLALAACHPHTARALPLHWPLRLLAAMAKVALRRPRATIDAVARSFVEVVAPGVTRTQCKSLGPGPTLKDGPILKAKRKAALDDGITVAMVLRVVRCLLQFQSGHGWATLTEHEFLHGDVDSAKLTHGWSYDDPSVIIAARTVAQLRGKHGEARGYDERVWSKGEDRRPDPFEDEVRCNRSYAAKEELYKRLLGSAAGLRETMAPNDVPSPLPRPLAAPFPRGAKAIKQSTLDVSRAAQGPSLLTLWKLTPQQTAPAVAANEEAAELTIERPPTHHSSPPPSPPKSPPGAGSAAREGGSAGPSTAGGTGPATSIQPSKRRKVVDNRDAFMRLFQPPKRAACVDSVAEENQVAPQLVPVLFEGVWDAETSAAAREARRCNSPSSRR